MDKELRIAQVFGTIPNLTHEQEAALIAYDTAPLDVDEREADILQGFEADRRLSILSTAVSFGVYTAVRLAVLGILTDVESLTKPWTSIVGDFSVEVAPVSVIEAEVEPTLDTSVPVEAVVEAVVTPAEVPVEAAVEVPVVETPSVEVPAEVPVVEPVVSDPAAGAI